MSNIKPINQHESGDMIRGSILIMSISFLAAVETIPNSALDPWAKLSATAVLGTVVIIMIWKLWPAAIKTWRDDNKESQEKLAVLVQQSTKVIERNTVATNKQTETLSQMKEHCTLVNRDK